MPDPEPTEGLVFKILLLFLLIIINAFFAMSEIAVISLNDNKIEKMAAQGNKKARQVLKLTSNSSRFLSTIQIGVTLAGFLTSASASQSFARLLAGALEGVLPVPATVINGISVVLITLVMSYFSLVLGELAPKRIAMQAPEKISFAVVGPLLAISAVLKPLVRFLSFSTNCIVRLFGFDPNAHEEEVTEEEILMMVDVGEEKGVIEESQKEMINNVFEFDDIDVSDIMTHRTDITAVDVNQSIREALDIAGEGGLSRLPVFEEDLDSVVGVIYVKDLLPYVGRLLPGDKTLRDFMHQPYFIPETKRCGELFSEMTERHMQIAIVVDEYGGTAGLVSMEDLLESIVGNIQDEYDDEEEEISKINETTFTIDGTADIEEVSEIIGAPLPAGEYDTLGGFIINLLGYIPGDGETPEAEYESLRFTVEQVEEHRIGKVRVEIKKSADAQQAQTKKDKNDKQKR